ncbi:MAG TPA: hypothetical protein VGM06_16405 [Polyangiaceae bacterium]|jgi:hypothetical protein
MSEIDREHEALEEEADATRVRLVETLDALDEREAKLEAVSLPVRRHPVLSAAMGVSLLLAFAGAIGALAGHRFGRRQNRRMGKWRRVWAALQG